MDPATAGISLGLNAASGIMGAIGANAEGESNAAAYRYKAGLALMNQKINKQNADWAREAGGINAMEAGLKSRQEIGQTKVQQAASGFDVNRGSPAEVREAQGRAAAFDQEMIRYDASKTAYGYEAKAAADEAESRMMESAAQNARKAGRIKAFTSILGGASSVASKWSQGNLSGMFGGDSANIGVFDSNNYGAAPTWTRMSR